MASNHLVYDRSAQQNGGQEVYWMAWEEGVELKDMERVVWVTVQNVKKTDGSIGDANLWVKVSQKDNPGQYWNGVDFADIPR